MAFLDHTACLGGGEIALFNLIEHLDRAFYQPVVLLFSQGPLVERLTAAGVETHVVPLADSIVHARKDGLGMGTLLKLRDGVRLLGFAERLSRNFKRLRVDLVHANSLKADIIGGIAGRLAGIPVIWHVRDRIADDYLPPLVVHCFRILCRLLPSFVIANSQATLATLPKVTWQTTISSGMSFRQSPKQIVHDGLASTEIAEELVVTSQKVGIVGRLAPWKGQHIFIRAAAQVVEHFPSVQFEIVGASLFGENEYEQELHTLVRELKLSDRVNFAGFRNDVPDLVAGFDLLVHASTTGEPFGQVVIEGMSAGKPVIATNGGGIPEIVIDGITGLLVPMGEVEPMAQAICKLLAEPELRRKMGRLGRERVLEHFTIEQTALKVQAVYDYLLIRHTTA